MLMQLGILTLKFHLEGCNSLKEKRQRMRGLKDRFGKLPHIAVCESGAADSLSKSEWSFVCLAHQRSDIARALEKIETHAALQLDAQIYDRQIEYL